MIGTCSFWSWLLVSKSCSFCWRIFIFRAFARKINAGSESIMHCISLFTILTQVHTLLYYPVTLAAVFAVMEMAKRDNWAIAMVRISAIMVHGAWMVQVYVVFLYLHWFYLIRLASFSILSGWTVTGPHGSQRATTRWWSCPWCWPGTSWLLSSGRPSSWLSCTGGRRQGLD